MTASVSRVPCSVSLHTSAGEDKRTDAELSREETAGYRDDSGRRRG